MRLHSDKIPIKKIIAQFAHFIYVWTYEAKTWIVKDDSLITKYVSY